MNNSVIFIVDNLLRLTRRMEKIQVAKYRILTEFKVFMYWKDPPRANCDAEPRSGEALRFVRAGHSSTLTPKNEVSIRLTQRRVKFSS